MISKLVIIASFFVLTACFALPVEEPVLPPPIVQAFQPSAHDAITLTRGNLYRYRNLNVSIVPAMEVTLSFLVPDVYIHAIHVSVGDEVQAGEIVAELDREAFARALYHAQRYEMATQINMAHLNEQQSLNAMEAILRGEAIDESRYDDERIALQAELAARHLTTEHIRAEDERRVLRAPFDGTVTHTMAFREGDTSVLDSRAVTIADEAQSIFSVSGRETQYLIPGDIHIVTVNGDPHDAVVIDPDEWGIEANDEQAFLTTYGDEMAYFPARVFATLQLILEEVQDVISIPFTALHVVEDQSFVYVIEDGIRVMRNVETGMEGNAGIEIIRGLSEGEIVTID